jgi:hypothetical protein
MFGLFEDGFLYVDLLSSNIEKFFSFVTVLHHLMVLLGVNGDQEGFHVFCLGIGREGPVRVGLGSLEKTLFSFSFGSLLVLCGKKRPRVNGKCFCDLDDRGDRGNGHAFFDSF